jgi:hypothetical protein
LFIVVTRVLLAAFAADVAQPMNVYALPPFAVSVGAVDGAVDTNVQVPPYVHVVFPGAPLPPFASYFT